MPTENPTTADSSVLFALKELEQLEGERQARERAEAEARRAEQAAREAEEARRREEAEEAERAAREHAAKVAREEARMNVEAKVEERTAASEQRLDAMRQELAQIRAEREALHRRVLAGTVPETAPQRRGFGVAFGLSVAASAVLATLLVVKGASPAPSPRVIVREVPVETAAEPVPEAEEAPPVEAEATAPEPVAEPAPEPTPRVRRERARTGRVRTPATTMRDRHERALERMDECGDDPLCMID